MHVAAVFQWRVLFDRAFSHDMDRTDSASLIAAGAVESVGAAHSMLGMFWPVCVQALNIGDQETRNDGIRHSTAAMHRRRDGEVSIGDLREGVNIAT